MADQELNPANPPWLHLLSAFLAMESTDSLIALARVCGEGSLTEKVQMFIWNHCITESIGKFHEPYLKKFLKKLIVEAESSSCTILDDIYERYAHYMSYLKDDFVEKESRSVHKFVSFLFPEKCSELSSCPKSNKLVIPLQCSLNMLEGDTGCSVWPSSLYLSEFILTFPELFSNKSCFEVGSGVGLVGICLAHVKASKVILSDGDLLTLTNMRLNLELNGLSVETDKHETTGGPKNKVKCVNLPWESATEEQLLSFKPDIILGADVIYDPLCLPHLVRVLQTLLNHTISHPNKPIGDFHIDDRDNGNDNDEGFVASRLGSIKGPVAILASVIRNVDTFNSFLALIDEASLAVTDLTETVKPMNLLPYMHSYKRSDIRLFIISYQ